MRQCNTVQPVQTTIVCTKLRTARCRQLTRGNNYLKELSSSEAIAEMPSLEDIDIDSLAG